MATRNRREKVGGLVAEVEAVAKRLRAGIRTRAATLPKELSTLAGRLRKQAAHAAAQVEKYAHEIRLELEGGGRKTKSRSAKAIARKRRAA